MSLTKENKGTIINTYRIHASDTGSPEVQIALLSERINYLTEHFKTHKKDRWCPFLQTCQKEPGRRNRSLPCRGSTIRATRFRTPVCQVSSCVLAGNIRPEPRARPWTEAGLRRAPERSSAHPVGRIPSRGGGTAGPCGGIEPYLDGSSPHLLATNRCIGNRRGEGRARQSDSRRLRRRFRPHLQQKRRVHRGRFRRKWLGASETCANLN